MSRKHLHKQALALAVSIVLAGCQSVPTPKPGPEPKPEKERTWVAIDRDAAPGTAAEIRVDDSSDSQGTTFDLIIHGFWVEEKRGPDQEIYQRIEIPGLGSHNQEGAPDLPLARFNLAIPTDAKQADLSVERLEVRSFPNYRIWPQPVPERDHPEGDPERFVLNREIYDSNAFWPPAAGVRRNPVRTQLRSIPAIAGEVWPVRWHPKTLDLEIATHTRYTYSHPGNRQEFKPMTRDRGRQAKLYFLNWPAVVAHFPINFVFYSAEFLIIYPDQSYADEIAPFANQKRARGFKVTEMTADDIGSTCAQIRSAIDTWEAAVPASRDAYALLVGDVDVIPLCTSPTGVPTDDLYASTNGDDLSEEIYLGRLSVDSEADAANQIQKILTYEDNPSLFCCYNRAALWAHKQDAPGKYEGAHETVRTNAYSVPPTFTTFYGSQAGVTDSDINNQVDSGVGTLAYRGHGSSSSTATGWNQNNEFYNSADANTLANSTPRSPIVWSFACTNTALGNEDSISEVWMEQAGTGAVSYYGATVASYTSQNHVLDEWMFKAVYDEGLVTQSHAIERAEAQMAALSGSSNAWMYLLLGDPDLQIRRRNPIGLEILIAREIETCFGPGCFLEIRVLDDKGLPVPDALVGLWKPGFGDLPEEVFVNRYTDNEGRAELPAAPASAGKLFYAVEDGQGNAVFDAIEVVQ